MNTLLQVAKLHPEALIPQRANAQAAGYDLYAVNGCSVPAHGRRAVQTGIAIAIPPETYGRIAPRSGLAIKNGIDVGAGVIDADYRGEVCVILFNHDSFDYHIKKGDRIAQLILERIVTPDVQVVETLDVTERGQSGFGSTGK